MWEESKGVTEKEGEDTACGGTEGQELEVRGRSGAKMLSTVVPTIFLSSASPRSLVMLP